MTTFGLFDHALRNFRKLGADLGLSETKDSESSNDVSGSDSVKYFLASMVFRLVFMAIAAAVFYSILS